MIEPVAETERPADAAPAVHESALHAAMAHVLQHHHPAPPRHGIWREALFLLAGALLAVGAEDVRDRHHRAVREATVLRAVREEIRENLRTVTVARQHHLRMADTLESYAARHAVPPASVYMAGLFKPGLQQTSAWQAAISTGVSAMLPFESELAISRVYEKANRYRTMGDAIGQGLMNDLARSGSEQVLRDGYRNFIPLERDFAGRERSLATAYVSAIRVLEHEP